LRQRRPAAVQHAELEREEAAGVLDVVERAEQLAVAVTARDLDRDQLLPLGDREADPLVGQAHELPLPGLHLGEPELLTPTDQVLHDEMIRTIRRVREAPRPTRAPSHPTVAAHGPRPTATSAGTSPGPASGRTRRAPDPPRGPARRSGRRARRAQAGVTAGSSSGSSAAAAAS